MGLILVATRLTIGCYPALTVMPQTTRFAVQKQNWRALLKKEMCYFCLPYGKKRHFTEEVKGKVKQAGYKAAFTTENREIDTHATICIGTVLYTQFPCTPLKLGCRAYSRSSLFLHKEVCRNR